MRVVLVLARVLPPRVEGQPSGERGPTHGGGGGGGGDGDGGGGGGGGVDAWGKSGSIWGFEVRNLKRVNNSGETSQQLG